MTLRAGALSRRHSFSVPKLSIPRTRSVRERSSRPGRAGHPKILARVVRDHCTRTRIHMHETRLTSLMILWLKLLSCIRCCPACFRYNYLLRHGLKTRGLFRKPGENNLVKACLHALIPVTLRSHLDATISSCNLCDSSLCLFGCAQKLRDMYDREETFDLATEVGGTGESSVHCVASLLKVWRAHAKCLCFIGIGNDDRILSWLKVGP